MKQLLIPGIFCLLLFSNCKKSTEQNADSALPQYGSLIEVKQLLMAKIIVIAKNSPEFKKTVESECLKQTNGDYEVTMDRLIEIDQRTSIIPDKDKKVFISLVRQMKAFRPNETPVIFVPVMETRDPAVKSDAPLVENQDSVLKQFAPNPNHYVVIVDRDNEIRPKVSDNQPTTSGLRENDEPYPYNTAPFNPYNPCPNPSYMYFPGFIN